MTDTLDRARDRPIPRRHRAPPGPALRGVALGRSWPRCCSGALERTGLAADAYLERLDSTAPFGDEVRQLARELTVGETYFFRNIDQFHAVAQVVLPERIAARAATRTLSILSAGCASGEEPYSLAMLAREQIADPRWTVSIRGVDINPAALEKAAAARYSTWSLRETPADAQARWFRPHGRELTIDPTDPRRGPLRRAQPGRRRPDAVRARDLRPHLLPQRDHVLHAGDGAGGDRAPHRALVPGGYLFLGHAETLRGLSHDFHLRHTHGTFYYQRRDDRLDAGRPGAAHRAARRRRATRPGSRPSSARATASARWPPSSSRRRPPPAARRRAGRALRGGAAAGAPPGGRAPDLAPVMESLAQERFAEALGLLHALPSDTAADPDSLLLRAALLTHSGRLDDAERACAELLGLDELNAGAHYLLALCREGRGDRAAAIDHDQVAVYLDPAFAMPRLHMGLLARRSGQADVARRELGLALPLLQREDTSRLLLFGGGFNRDTLTALCRAELGATRSAS